jgi:NAD(P)-dependent dehydrogenase (short-subunit alcohol dehydrogenase family)
MSKKCFVIGYGPGVGHGAAAAFASAGFELALFSRTPTRHEGLREQLSTSNKAFAVDAGDPAALALALEEAMDKVGRPDALIYNAVAFRAAKPTEISGQQLLADFSTNVLGALVATQTVLPSMRNLAGLGTIIFTGGGWALYPDAAVASTAIGKTSLRHLALMLHQELRDTNVRVGTVTILGQVAPGTPFDPGEIGRAFLTLAQQPTAEFQAELKFTGSA